MHRRNFLGALAGLAAIGCPRKAPPEPESRGGTSGVSGEDFLALVCWDAGSSWPAEPSERQFAVVDEVLSARDERYLASLLDLATVPHPYAACGGRAYETGSVAILSWDPATGEAPTINRSWLMTEHALVSNGEALPRVPGHNSFWFAVANHTRAAACTSDDVRCHPGRILRGSSHAIGRSERDGLCRSCTS